MHDPPKAAIDAAARAIVAVLYPGTGDDPSPLDLVAAERGLRAAEKVWPHKPEARDPASTVTGALNLATAPARLPSAEAPGKPGFGFGPPGVRS